MGKNLEGRPSYLASDRAKHSLGLNRGPLATTHDGDVKLEQVASAGGVSLAPNRPLKAKLLHHWKRFWFLYLVGNVILLAILLPIFFLIVIPAISQLVLDKSSLVLVSASVMQPRANSVQLSLTSKLDLKIALPVRIDPITLDLYVQDLGKANPWGNITIAGTTIKGNTSLGVENVHVPFMNSSSWTGYVRDVVFQEKTGLSLNGTTDSFLGVLKSRVTMNKDVVSPTLNSFKGFSMANTYLALPPHANGNNLFGSLTLPNPSVLTIQIGDIYLDIKSGNLPIGNATVKGLILKPGDNTLPLEGILDLNTIITNLGEVLKSQKSLFTTGDLSLTTYTRSVVWDGEEVPYYTKVMSELPLVAKVPLLSTIMNTISHLNLTALEQFGANGHGGGLLSGLSGLGNSSSTSGLSKARMAAGLASALKRNVHVREALQTADPVKRDAMINSLSGLVQRL